MKIKTSGIYGIENVKTGEIYVGHSKDIAKRWSTHSTNLKNGTHYYKELQDGYNKNPSNIKYFIFTTCKESELTEQEDYYIKYVMKVDGWKLINKQKHGGGSKTVKDTSNMKKAQTGENNGNARLKDEEVKEIKSMLKNGEKQTNIAKKFHVSDTAIYNIKKGNRWSKIN